MRAVPSHTGEMQRVSTCFQRTKHITYLETSICHEKTAKLIILKILQNGGGAYPLLASQPGRT